MTATLDHEMTDLRRANAELQRRLDEAVADRDEGEAQRAAIAEILEVINDSPGDLAKVFDAILEKAHRLCGASKGSLVTLDGEHFRTVAMRGLSERYAAILRDAGHNVPGSAPDRLLKGESLVHVADARGSAFSVPRAAADLEGVRTIAYVPLRKESALLGYITAYRQEVRPFTDKQIALLQSFAAQAVIAMENARLITETREALEQQTATAEVLQVINSSPGDLGPVFDAMLEKATRLSEAAFGIMQVYDGERFRTVATRNMPPALAEFLLHTPRQPTPHSAVSRILDGEDFVHFEDMTSEQAYLSGDPRQQAFVELGGTRTYVAVALRKDDRLLGTIATYRQEIRPFSDKQIALLQNFAAQAVIAMENARLITETREALEQQTATADVLQVINSSLGDLKPVFDTMLDKAMRLCDAACSALNVYDGGWIRTIASRGMPVELAAFLEHPVRPEPGTASMRLIRGETYVHIADLMEDEGTQEGNLARRTFVKMGGARTQLAVPLRKDNTLLGIFIIYRQEVRPFTDKQITLLQNFAAQAVVAIENARLLTETREALEQQTATAEVLQVINSSPGDLAPVFDAMLERAMRLCEAAFGLLFTYDGEHISAAALHNIPKGFAEFLQGGPVAPAPHTTLSRAIQERRPVQIMDVLETAQYRDGDPFAVTAVEAGGVRTVLSVPLLKDEVPVGVIGVYRQEVRSFSDKQIALLQNFAAQAVIAMENARLITETREALEQQTATAEVLRVINSSPGDLNPVFDAMLEKAMRLCGAAFGFMTVIEGEQSRTVAARGVPAAYAAFRERNPTPANAPISSRVRKGEPFIHTVDLKAERFYGEGDPQRRAIVDLGGARTLLAVPLMRDQAVLGAIQVYRTEVRPFSDKEIALLQNFAAQAVIAMENARLLTETREALEQQTATAEVLQAINSSPGDLGPVFEAILEKAHSLCGVSYGSLQLYDGEKFRAVAVHGLSGALADHLRQGYSPGPTNPVRRLLEGERFAHIPDLAEIDDPFTNRVVELGGTRTLLWVALRKDKKLLGLIAAARLEVRPFSDKQIALLENFAAQAVIAMENARLLTETREALEQQTATAEVLQVINSSPGHLAPVFDAMLDKAMRLCGAAFGMLQSYDGERFEAAALRGLPPTYAEFLRSNPPPSGPGTAPARIVCGEPLVHVPDLKAEDAYVSGDPRRRAMVDLGGARSSIAAALRKDDKLLGSISVYRQEVKPFTDKQISLLQNFAAQAVIAMENARLLTETRESLDQQTATAEVLQVINSSPGDLAPVFNAMLEKALRLCGGSFGELRTYDGERFRLVATHGVPTAYVQYYSRGDAGVYGPGTGPARILAGERLVHIPDLIATEPYQRGDPDRVALVDLGGARAYVLVPLLKDGAVLGYIMIYRMEAGSFSDKQITLLQNFAAQAVIAIENARLLDEIRQRQAELRVTFDNMADGVAMFDEELRLTAWNRNFQQILDLPDVLLAKRPTYAEYVHILADRGEFGTGDIEEELSRRLEDTDQELRLERTRPDGKVIEVRRNAVPGGGFVLIYSDITERKLSEAEIHAARDAAEAAYRDLKAAQASLIQAEKMASLGQLTAGIAHEIKNPLNFVNNFAGLSVELLDELKETAAPAITALDDERRTEIDETMGMLTGNLEKIAEHGRRADGIVKSMLEHSRGTSGERRSVDLNGLIEEALNLAYHGARAQDHTFNITLERDFTKGIAPIELVPQDITRVCLNLIGNGYYAATKRQKEGSDPTFKPTLKVTTRDLKDAVEIAVRDNGTGILPEIKDKLFQPFFTTKPTGEGTGLGLSISYDIVTQGHGGTITVDSRVGEFTEFTVRLPRVYRATMAEAAS